MASIYAFPNAVHRKNNATNAWPSFLERNTDTP
jgi:hypothetical protein